MKGAVLAVSVLFLALAEPVFGHPKNNFDAIQNCKMSLNWPRLQSGTVVPKMERHFLNGM